MPNGGTEVMSSWRKADVSECSWTENLHVNFKVKLEVNGDICETTITNVTYARTDVTPGRNAICPTSAKAGGSIKMLS